MITLLYPGKAKKEYQKFINYANRGMDLENLINEANDYYLKENQAIIYKKPTPVDIKKITYKGKTEYIEGVLKQKSTLDYVGVYKGKYLDFDAKSTKSKTSFALSNIHNHQLKHIERIIDNGGISFLIIEINSQFFILDGKILLEFIHSNSRKSIPYEFIKACGIEIKLNYNPTLDYLKEIDRLF